MSTNRQRTLSDDDGAMLEFPITDSVGSHKSSAMRRRTKTGCLTCRKRRIKCGEERPICKNCVKSKRDCAGYVQPLVYKQHVQPAMSDTTDLLQSTTSIDSHFNNQIANIAPPFTTHPGISVTSATTQRHQVPDQSSLPSLGVLPGHSDIDSDPGLGQASSSVHAQNWLPTYPDRFQNHLTLNTDLSQLSATVLPSYASASYFQPRRTSDNFAESAISGPGSLSRSTTSTPYQQHSYGSWTPYTPFTAEAVTQQYPLSRNDLHWQEDSFHGESYMKHNLSQMPNAPQPMQYTPQHLVQTPTAVPTTIVQMNQAEFSHGHYDALEDMLDNPDDPWDVDVEDSSYISDFEADSKIRLLLASSQSARSHLSNLIIKQPPNRVLSPLLEERNFYLFQHFVSNLATSISIYERPGLMISKRLLKTIWGYSLPAIALGRPALGHAMLALSAVHCAKLQGISEDNAMKHFTHALRRVGTLLAQSKHRHEVATLATVLLLSFYEIVVGDHSRWILHLSGAGTLLMEHDFAGMMRRVLQLREHARSKIGQHWTKKRASLSGVDLNNTTDIPNDLLRDEDWDVDSDLVSKLSGFDIQYESQVHPDFPTSRSIVDLNEREIELWKVKMDLYWWYCKMDIYQSMLSGDQLLMPYEQWQFCPPRGPIGCLKNACATTDHLWLILARLTDFGGRDRKRKQQVVASQGGQWIPPPGFFGTSSGNPMAKRPSSPEADLRFPPRTNLASAPEAVKAGPKTEPPPSANEGRVRKGKSKGHSLPSATPTPPAFYGMMPPSAGPVHMHSSFHAMDAQLRGEPRRQNSQRSDSTSSSNLDTDTASSLLEYASIEEGLETWKRALGPGFDPLSNDPETTIHTPFGPVLRYHNPIIACTWAFYYTSKILLRRLHPHSPPAAMISAGVNAGFTREYAQMIGRIVGGLHASWQYARQTNYVNHDIIAAVQETTFPLMFSGVQYQEANQREWTIDKLRDVAESTGWKSSAAIAAACETTWYKMGVAGKGPPYERTLDRENTDVRVRGLSLNHQITTGSSSGNALDDHESRFVSHDRNLIDRHTSTRTYWALGLLSVEEDIKKLSVGP